MNGHDLKEGTRVRVVLSGRNGGVLGKDHVSSRAGTVEKVGPSPLGAMPSWALVHLDGDDEFAYRFNVWDLVPENDAPNMSDTKGET